MALYLKQVGGPVLAALNENMPFEPASAIKILPLLYALREVEYGHASLTQRIPIYAKPPSGSCPGSATDQTETLGDALKGMLWDSDNERTKAIVEHFGRDNLNSMTRSLGVTNLLIEHTLGCGDEAVRKHNQMTMTDAGLLIEGVAAGKLLDAADRALFLRFMSGKEQAMETGQDSLDIWHMALPAMLDREAQSLDLTSRRRESFHDRIDLAYKDGRYILCRGGGLCTEYRSLVGWLQLPWCDNSRPNSRQYVFGLYIDDSISPTLVDDAFEEAKVELLREQIHAAMAAWSEC